MNVAYRAVLAPNLEKMQQQNQIAYSISVKGRDQSQALTYSLYQPAANAFSDDGLLVFASEVDAKRRPGTVARARVANATREIIFCSM